MNLNNTVYNWKWWLVLPLALLVLTFLAIPKVIILMLEVILFVANFCDVGSYSFKWSKRLVDWVHKD